MGPSDRCRINSDPRRINNDEAQLSSNRSIWSGAGLTGIRHVAEPRDSFLRSPSPQHRNSAWSPDRRGHNASPGRTYGSLLPLPPAVPMTWAETALPHTPSPEQPSFWRWAAWHELCAPLGVAPSTSYEPRQPASSVLHQLVRDHFETFRTQAADLRDESRLRLPPRVFLQRGWGDLEGCAADRALETRHVQA